MGYENNNGEKNYNKKFNNDKRSETIFSKKWSSGRKRTYFFDVRTTKSNDYFLSITESVKRYNEEGYDRHKLVVYKEDLNKFVEYLTDTANHIKTELMPDFDFEQYNREQENEYNNNYQSPAKTEDAPATYQVSEQEPQAEAPTPPAPTGEAPSLDTEVDAW